MSIKVNEISNFSQYNQNTQKISFRASETPVDTEQKPDTFEKEGLSTEAKIGIGVGSILGLIAIGLGIKKGLNVRATNKAAREAAEKATKEAAEALGIKDVKVYKSLKNIFGENITKVDEIGDEAIIQKSKELVKKFGLEGTDGSIAVMDTKVTKEYLLDKCKLKDSLPENLITLAVNDEKNECKHIELIIADKLDESLNNLFKNSKGLVILK